MIGGERLERLSDRLHVLVGLGQAALGQSALGRLLVRVLGSAEELIGHLIDRVGGPIVGLLLLFDRLTDAVEKARNIFA